MSGFTNDGSDVPTQQDTTMEEQLDVDDDELVEGRDFEVVVPEDAEADQALLQEMENEEDDNVELAPESEEDSDNSKLSFAAHSDSVYSIAVSKDGKFVVSGGGDDVACVTQLQGEGGAPQVTLKLTGHTDTVVEVALNHDESLIATASYDGTVKVWESSNGKLLHTLDGPSSEIEWMRWHPVGDVVLAGSSDATGWMWNARSGQCMSVFAGHEASLTCGSFTTNGKRVLTGSLDGSVRMWDPKTGQCVHNFVGHGWHEYGVVSLALHPVEPMIAAGGQDGTVRVARLDSKKILSSFKHSMQVHKPLVAGADGVVPQNSDDQQAEPSPDDAPPSVEAVAFCAGQPWLASGGTDGAIKIWDLNTLNCRFSFQQHKESIVKIAFLTNTSLLVSCSMDSTLKLWDSRSGNLVQDMKGHDDAVLDFKVVSDMLVSASDDHSCKVFQLTQQ